MEKENKSKKFWDYALLIVGGILILIPLLYTFLSSFKTTKQIMNHFFAWPNPWTTANFQRLFSDGVMGYFWNSIVITVLSIVLVMISSQWLLTLLLEICQNIQPLIGCISC